MGKSKIAAMCDWGILKSVKELRSYPRLANHNRQFVEGFLRRASSLTELLKEDIQWGGNFKCQAAYDSLKHYVLLPLADHLCVENSLQVHKIAKEWRACLEKASRRMEKRMD
ncbi:polyprotein [Cucumis melo var. makuwa]|uniref:Polyprotein n=1 Tax=Cucumis melo var. makuwa TaxID=1194695 RepID=A0A5D3B816_CUCMM|nr:polyprotein [Cucumis melo var. makuwa]